MTDENSNFGQRLLAAREQRGLSQTELARLSGLQPAAIGHFERDRRKPSFANVRALAKALSVSSDYLLGRTEEMKGATTAFRGEERLTTSDRDFIQMMIDQMNEKKKEAGK
jgi:transcriptional regulator with XRE-family HTH domain